MPIDFYSDPGYKKKQSQITKKYWQEGKYNFLINPPIDKICDNTDCRKIFQTKPFDPKRYCSKSCAAHSNNQLRPKKINKCLSCEGSTKRSYYKYCSNKCQRDNDYRKYIKRWKEGSIDGNIGIVARGFSPYIRRYLFEKYSSKCSICGWDKRHSLTNRIPLEVDHIDGNAENNKEDNLRLVCPNCHSLTASFRNLNKGKGRSWRLKKIASF